VAVDADIYMIRHRRHVIVQTVGQCWQWGWGQWSTRSRQADAKTKSYERVRRCVVGGVQAKLRKSLLFALMRGDEIEAREEARKPDEAFLFQKITACANSDEW